MKTRNYIVIWILTTCSAFANTREIQIQSATDAICFTISQFALKYPSSELTNWAQLEEFDFELKGLNAYFPSSSVGDQFSFIRPQDRKKYPDGELLLVQTQPMEWPSEWIARDPAMPSKGLEGKNYESIRFIIYKSNGRVMSSWVKERLFNETISETGILLEPKKSSLIYAKRDTSVKYNGLLTSAKSTPPEPAVDRVKTVVDAPKKSIPAKPLAEKSYATWWFAGLLIIFIGGVLVARKRKLK